MPQQNQNNFISNNSMISNDNSYLGTISKCVTKILFLDAWVSQISSSTFSKVNLNTHFPSHLNFYFRNRYIFNQQLFSIFFFFQTSVNKIPALGLWRFRYALSNKLLEYISNWCRLRIIIIHYNL